MDEAIAKIDAAIHEEHSRSLCSKVQDLAMSFGTVQMIAEVSKVVLTMHPEDSDGSPYGRTPKWFKKQRCLPKPWDACPNVFGIVFWANLVQLDSLYVTLLSSTTSGGTLFLFVLIKSHKRISFDCTSQTLQLTTLKEWTSEEWGWRYATKFPLAFLTYLSISIEIS